MKRDKLTNAVDGHVFPLVNSTNGGLADRALSAGVAGAETTLLPAASLMKYHVKHIHRYTYTQDGRNVLESAYVSANASALNQCFLNYRIKL